jgi:hypothetical protein
MLAAATWAGAACSSAAVAPPATPIEVARATAPLVLARARALAPAVARDGAGVPGAFAFVETFGATTWVLLAAGDADLADSEPSYRTDPSSGVVALEAKVAQRDLDPALRLRGRAFDLWSGAERGCTVRVGSTRLLGVTAMPDDILPTLTAGTQAPAPTAPEVWPFARYYLAAEVHVPRGCEGATWARLSELPAPRVVGERATVEPPLQADLSSRFRLSAGWRAAQEEYAASQARSNLPAGVWQDAGSGAHRVWDDGASGASWMLQQAVWDEGCAASASLTMVWHSAGGAMSPVFEGDDRTHVELVLDLEGDGRLEMLTTDGYGGRSLMPFWGATNARRDARPDQGATYLDFSVPAHGCGC